MCVTTCNPFELIILNVSYDLQSSCDTLNTLQIRKNEHEKAEIY